MHLLIEGSPPSFRGHQPDSLQLLGRQQCPSHRNLHLNILKKMNMKTQRPNDQKSGKVFVKANFRNKKIVRDLQTGKAMWQCVAALPSWAPSAAFVPHAKRIRIHQDQNHRHMITTWSHINAFSLGVLDALWLWRTCGSWRSSKCQYSIRRKTPWDPSRFRLALLPTTIWCPDKIKKKHQGLQRITVQVVTRWHPTVSKGFHLGLLLSNLNSAGGIRKPSASIWVARDTESWFTREKLNAAKEQMHHHRCVSPKGCLNKTCMLQRRVDAYASSHLKS